MGLICGGYGGRSDDFLPGGASYECGFTPVSSMTLLTPLMSYVLTLHLS